MELLLNHGKKTYMSKLNYWDSVFEGNAGYYGDVDALSRIEITKYIGPNDTVLDAGCGIGTLKRLLPDNEYTGFDYSPRAVRIACKTQGKATFMAADSRQMKDLFNDNEFDIVVMRHFLENQEDWKEVIRQAFRICRKKVIINIRRPFAFGGGGRLVEQKEDTWVWDFDYYDFNNVCRDLSVNVSFGKVGDEEFIIIGKHLDEVVFDLDDECDELSALPRLLELKERFPKLKVTLFAIPSKCSPEHLEKLSQYDWIRVGLHGYYHDTEHGRATECNHWSYEDAVHLISKGEEILSKASNFTKVFRPPGWNINWETYKALAEKGYIIADHLSHDLYLEQGGERYTTGNLAEVHGHTWECNGNGIQELSERKCNFGPNTEFYFIDEFISIKPNNYLPNRFQ